MDCEPEFQPSCVEAAVGDGAVPSSLGALVTVSCSVHSLIHSVNIYSGPTVCWALGL